MGYLCLASSLNRLEAFASGMDKLFLALLVAAALVLAGCSSGKGSDTNGFTFEQACRLNGFSWITKQPQQHGIALKEDSCLGCTVDVDNHFCKDHESAFETYVGALSDFRDMCKSYGGEWMLMEPMENNVELSDKMCWGCMADDQTHICSTEEFLSFERNTTRG